MDYREQRWRDFLEGNRAWELKEDAKGNHDIFLTEFVLPLRWLRSEGRIERIHEHHSGGPGSLFVDRVDVDGVVNVAA